MQEIDQHAQEYVERHLQTLRAGGWVPAEPNASGVPDVRAENRALLAIASFMLLACAIVGGLYCYLGSSASYGLLTGGLNRFITIRQFYRSPPAALASGQQPIIALGDSLTVEGLDCNLLDELRGPGAPPSFNLGMPSKGDAEYLLDLEQPVVQRARVVLLVDPASTFSSAETIVPANRANMIRLLDYPLDRSAWEEYARLIPHSGVEYLLAPRYQHILDSRWRLASNFERKFKLHVPGVPQQWLTKMRYIEFTYSENLKHATPPIQFSVEQMKSSLAERIAADPGLIEGSFKPSPTALAAYNFVMTHLAARTQGVVLVIAPLHPLLAASLGPAGIAQFKAQMESYASDKVRVLDFSDMLPAEDFRDEVHPNQAGAEKITRALAQELGLGQAAPS